MAAVGVDVSIRPRDVLRIGFVGIYIPVLNEFTIQVAAARLARLFRLARPFVSRGGCVTVWKHHDGRGLSQLCKKTVGIAVVIFYEGKELRQLKLLI